MKVFILGINVLAFNKVVKVEINNLKFSHKNDVERSNMIFAIPAKTLGLRYAIIASARMITIAMIMNELEASEKVVVWTCLIGV